VGLPQAVLDRKTSMIPPSQSPEILPDHPPVVPLPQDPFIPRGRLQRLVNLFPPGQFTRYVCVGICNTLFAYVVYVAVLTLLNAFFPARWLYLTVMVASILATPVNITFAYFGYKFFVFRTHGNYLREWLKCFAVYGMGMIPGLVALSALTRFLQSMMHRHASLLHQWLHSVELHLTGRPLAVVQYVATGKAMAGYIAGALIIGLSTSYSFVGHKKITFRTKSGNSVET